MWKCEINEWQVNVLWRTQSVNPTLKSEVKNNYINQKLGTYTERTYRKQSENCFLIGCQSVTRA